MSERWEVRGAALNGIREAQGLTYVRLAELAGVSQWPIYRLCTGATLTASRATVEALARALKVSPVVIAIPPSSASPTVRVRRP